MLALHHSNTPPQAVKKESEGMGGPPLPWLSGKNKDGDRKKVTEDRFIAGIQEDALAALHLRATVRGIPASTVNPVLICRASTATDRSWRVVGMSVQLASHCQGGQIAMRQQLDISWHAEEVQYLQLELLSWTNAPKESENTGGIFPRESSRSFRSTKLSNPAASAFGDDFGSGFQKDSDEEEYSSDEQKQEEDKTEFIGIGEVTLGSIIGSPASCVDLTLLDSSGTPTNVKLRLTVDQPHQALDCVEFHVFGRGLAKKDFFGKSDPYLEVSVERVDPNGSERGRLKPKLKKRKSLYQKAQPKQTDKAVPTLHDDKLKLIARSEVLRNTLDPVWREFVIPILTLSGGSYTKPIHIDCFDWDRNSAPDLIGSVVMTLNDVLVSAKTGTAVPLIDSKKKDKSYRHSGLLYFQQTHVYKHFSCFDFLRGGYQMCCVVGVDFTASNGHYSNPSSLHHIPEPNGEPVHTLNTYMHLMFAFTEIIAQYSSSRQMHGFGFGGRPTGAAEVSHCFPLRPNHSEYVGTDGLLAAYQEAVGVVEQDGPTLLSSIIKKGSDIATARMENREYQVLLIVTDGEMLDQRETCEALLSAEEAPLSIVIVGIGNNSEFEKMEVLNDDYEGIDGRKPERRCCSFLHFKPEDEPIRFMRDAMKPIPGQFTNWALSLFPEPPPPVQPTDTNIPNFTH